MRLLFQLRPNALVQFIPGLIDHLHVVFHIGLDRFDLKQIAAHSVLNKLRRLRSVPLLQLHNLHARGQ